MKAFFPPQGSKTTALVYLALPLLPSTLTPTPTPALAFAPTYTPTRHHYHDTRSFLEGPGVSALYDAPDPSNDPDRVDVSVSAALPDVDPSTARAAWLDYTWSRGGGLPGIVMPVGGTEEEEEGTAYPQKRRLLPLFAEEEVVDDGGVVVDDGGGKGDGSVSNEGRGAVGMEVCYRLTRLGLWETEIVPDSHWGTVSFAPAPPSDTTDPTTTSTTTTSGTNITWTVTFRTLRNNHLWQTVTQDLITQATQNLASYLSPPLLLRTTTTFHPPPTPDPTKPPAADAVLDRWLRFVWRNGGGLPLPLPPIPLDPDCRRRALVPPFLVERILSVERSVPSPEDGYRSGDVGDVRQRAGAGSGEGGRERATSDGVAEVCYTVDNPSLVTYPVHSHFGSVRFRPLVDSVGGREGGVEMVWHVTVRPMAGFEAFVRLFTEVVVTVLVRNLKVNLEIRSNERRRVDGDGVWAVRSDSWVGGVMVSRSLDKRGFGERARDFLRPWRWGTIYDKDGNDEVVVEWLDNDAVDGSTTLQ